MGLVWDGSDRILYVDNLEVARDTRTSLVGADTGLYIGVGSSWSGLIDDVRIYNEGGAADLKRRQYVFDTGH